MTASPLITKIDELQEELLASLHEIRRHAAELTAERERLQPVAATLAGAYVSAITKGLPVAMGFLDSEGVLTYAESANLEPEHAGVAGGVGRSMFDLRGNVPQFTAALRRALTGERVRVNFENPCTPGREMEVVIEALRSADHEVSGLVAVATQASALRCLSPGRAAAGIDGLGGGYRREPGTATRQHPRERRPRADRGARGRTPARDDS